MQMPQRDGIIAKQASIAPYILQIFSLFFQFISFLKGN